MTCCSTEELKSDPTETDRVLAMLEGMALTCERDEVSKARADAKSAATAEYAVDVAHFAFDCSVWGGFLRLSIARGASPGYRNRSIMQGPQDFSTALYLPNIKTVTLESGNPPDDGGEVSYHYRWTKGSSKSDNCGRMILKFDSDFAIQPQYPHLPYARILFFEEKPPTDKNAYSMQSHGYSGQSAQTLKYKTTDFPRPASDDKIVIQSLGVTIYTPGGMGNELYEAILLATGQNGLTPILTPDTPIA